LTRNGPWHPSTGSGQAEKAVRKEVTFCSNRMPVWVDDSRESCASLIDGERSFCAANYFGVRTCSDTSTC